VSLRAKSMQLLIPFLLLLASCSDHPRTWDNLFDPSNLLSAPTLFSPANGAIAVSSTVTFSWSAVEGATKYWLTVATDQRNLPTNNYAESCGGGCVIATILPTPGYIATNLTSGTTYYWQVQAYDDRVPKPYHQGLFSSAWSFTVR
jgi:hypothetical protein